MKKSLTLIFLLITIVSISQQTGTITDAREGKVYKTVDLGNQTWMAENLNVSTFRNGDTILEVKTTEEWIKAGKEGKPAWCYYDNDTANGRIYGKLYNWYAVDDKRGLAPDGWHVATDEEWTTLSHFLGGEFTAGKKMKSLSGWKSRTSGGSKKCPNCASWNAEYRKKVLCHTCKGSRSVLAPKITRSCNGTNSSGFSGLPGGIRSGSKGNFEDIGVHGFWWTSTKSEADLAYFRHLLYDDLLLRFNFEDGPGLSVRCVKD